MFADSILRAEIARCEDRPSCGARRIRAGHNLDAKLWPLYYSTHSYCARRMHGDARAQSPGELRHDLSEQLQSLGNQLRSEKGCAVRFPPALPGWQPDCPRQDRPCRCHDGNLTGRLLGWNGSCRTLCHDDIDLSLRPAQLRPDGAIRFDSPKRRSKTMFCPSV